MRSSMKDQQQEQEQQQRPPGHPLRSSYCFWKIIVLSVACASMMSDLSQFARQRQPQNGQVWASWIGEVPTAAELYGDSSSAFEDDDDEDDGLDSAASNEYPDDQDQDQDQERDGAESRQSGRVWAQASLRKPVWGDLDGWRRNKRDIEDRMALASRRRAAASKRQQQQRPTVTTSNADEEFAIDDGDEDAWVHDGIDDIHIDPETKRAASEISSSLADDSNTIDSEYEPQQQQVLNRTRVTTISEVIPMSETTAGRDLASEQAGEDPSDSSSSLSSRYVKPHQEYLPAAFLTLDQASRLVEPTSRKPRTGLTWHASHLPKVDPRWRR